MPPGTPTSGENRAPWDLGSQHGPTVVRAWWGCSPCGVSEAQVLASVMLSWQLTFDECPLGAGHCARISQWLIHLLLTTTL